MLTVAMRLELGDGESLSSMTDGAAVLFDRMIVEKLQIGVGPPRLLHILQAAPQHPLMTGRTAVDPIEILGPDLLDPAWNRRGVDVTQGSPPRWLGTRLGSTSSRETPPGRRPAAMVPTATTARTSRRMSSRWEI